MSSFVESYLKKHGFTVEVFELEEPGRKNIYAYPGENRETKVLLTSHIDTVPPFFGYSVKDGNIYGRGSVDAKACVAAQTIALEELLESGDVGKDDVSLLFVVDEEVEGAGMRYVSDHIGYKGWDAVVFGEPTEGKLGVGHKGIAVFDIHVEGKASHSGYPELGINANTILIGALSEFLQHEWPSSDLLGPSTINVGSMNGGVAANVIPADASAKLAIRIAADPDRVESGIRSIVDRTEHLSLDSLYIVPPQYIDYEVPGFDTIVLKYSTDIGNLSGNFKRYLYGPGSILVAHSANEHVAIDELSQAVDDYKRLVKHLL